MRQAERSVIAAIAAVLLAAPAMAQNFEIDAALAYSARDEVASGTDGESLDNDLFRLGTGLTWSTTGGRLRAGVELGAMNNDFDGNYPWIAGAELVFARRVGDQRFGIGGRLRSSEDMSTTTELAYSYQYFSRGIDWHALAGVQFVADSDLVTGRDGAGAFGQGTAGVYLSPNWVLSVGVLGDNDGLVLGVGTEFHPAGSPISYFVDYAEAPDDYRGVASYDNLTAGIRYIPGGQTLRSYRRSSLVRILHRIVEVQ